jgi:hypothetical protein
MIIVDDNSTARYIKTRIRRNKVTFLGQPFVKRNRLIFSMMYLIPEFIDKQSCMLEVVLTKVHPDRVGLVGFLCIFVGI